ncbi:basic proline-rich protein-like [Phacochoerus africanus]|uniref:basic proline-rich protein-like n=1 Tax=Phacochoerus africanus TaxID=41426 RepID=UPI001FD91F62|nr:basic proline-rich protein-like [Phacochoerus africanus]
MHVGPDIEAQSLQLGMVVPVPTLIWAWALCQVPLWDGRSPAGIQDRPPPPHPVPQCAGPAPLLSRAEWKNPHPRPAPAPGDAAPDARQTVPPRREEGGASAGGARSLLYLRRRLGRALRNTVRRPRTSAARLPGPEAAGTRTGPLAAARRLPPGGSGGWARLRQSVRSEMAEPPRRGPRPREQGSRAAPGRGGARGQRGRRPVRRTSLTVATKTARRGVPGGPSGRPAFPSPCPSRRPPLVVASFLSARPLSTGLLLPSGLSRPDVIADSSPSTRSPHVPAPYAHGAALSPSSHGIRAAGLHRGPHTPRPPQPPPPLLSVEPPAAAHTFSTFLRGGPASVRS